MGLKAYDPFIGDDIVDNQYHSLDSFLADVDMVVIMVKHTEIRDNMQKLAGKIVLDCQNIIDLSVYTTYKNCRLSAAIQRMLRILPERFTQSQLFIDKKEQGGG